METIVGSNFNCYSYEQNADGKYDVGIEFPREGTKYRTGFIFDSIKLMNEFLLRVSQTDANGNTKYGVICSNGDFFIPCIFDKIKPYKDLELLAYEGEDKYIIDRQFGMFRPDFWDIRHP